MIRKSPWGKGECTGLCAVTESNGARTNGTKDLLCVNTTSFKKDLYRDAWGS